MFKISFVINGDNSATELKRESLFIPRIGDKINFGDIGCAVVDDVVMYVYPADGAIRGWRNDAVAICKLLSDAQQSYNELREW